MKIEIFEDNFIHFPKSHFNLVSDFCLTLYHENPDISDAYKSEEEKKRLPKFFSGFKKDTNEILFYKGLENQLRKVLESQGIEYSYKFDNNTQTTDFTFSNEITLYDYQQEAAQKFLQEKKGIVSFSCGLGKTVTAIYIISQLKYNALILVHTSILLKQWIENISKFLNIPSEEIGRIGSGKINIKPITVAMLQYLYRVENESIYSFFNIVVTDECHHIPANTFFSVITRFKARYLLGLTATPNRKDNKEFLLFFSIGDIIYRKEREIKEGKRTLYVIENSHINKQFTRSGNKKPKRLYFYVRKKGEKLQNWIDTVSALMQTSARNIRILQYVLKELNEGRKILFLSSRKDHCKKVYSFLQDKGFKCALKISEHNDDIDEKETQIIIGTKIADEGMDITWLETLFIVSPLSIRKSAKDLDQKIGRLERNVDSKEIRVYFVRDTVIDFLIFAADSIIAYLREKGYKVIYE